MKYSVASELRPSRPIAGIGDLCAYRRSPPRLPVDSVVQQALDGCDALHRHTHEAGGSSDPSGSAGAALFVSRG